tara:strand:- start:553 stop:660 length:108 start_codon:yes stop_codon:yes gene_type:complete
MEYVGKHVASIADYSIPYFSTVNRDITTVFRFRKK